VIFRGVLIGNCVSLELVDFHDLCDNDLSNIEAERRDLCKALSVPHVIFGFSLLGGFFRQQLNDPARSKPTFMM
jgi:hypothetical protein